MLEWKNIQWYNYKVSNTWLVKNNKTWKILNWFMNFWYHNVDLYNKWIKKKFRIHRLVAIAFIDNKNKKLEVNHIDWIRNNNNVENLEWVTSKENSIHACSVLWYKPYLVNNPIHKWKFWKDNHLSKSILQYKDWILIKEFNAYADAARELNTSTQAISNNIRWKSKTCMWFVFYINDKKDPS